jgi:hypothetical protein
MPDPFSARVFPKILTRYASWAAVTSAVDAILPPETPAEERKNYIERLASNSPDSMPALMNALVPHLIIKGWLDQFRVELNHLSQTNPILRRILSQQVAVDDDGVANPGNVQSLNNKVQPFLSSKTFFDGMEAARYRVCAIWIDNPVTGEAGIVGTGFLIAADLVLTARHVLEDANLVSAVQVAGAPAGVTRDEMIDGAEQRLAFIFDYWTPVNVLDIAAPPTGLKVVKPKPPGGNPPTKGWLEWSSKKHPADGVTHVFGPPSVSDHLDCAIIRLAERAGAASTGVGGGRVRGWQKLNGVARMPRPGSALAILQHPAAGPQMFDKGDFKDNDPAPARMFYSTNTDGGSSGSPCFDAQPDVIGFHNAGHPAAFNGPTSDCNQGVLVNSVIAALAAGRPELLNESRTAFKTDDGLWSLSDDPKKPEPILGRTDFKDAVFAMFDPCSSLRVLIVSEDSAAAKVGKSGKSFSTRILRAVARRRPATVVEFSAEEIKGIKSDKPEEFLFELGRRIGLDPMDGMPEKPADERQLTRWWANDLPKWFGQLIEDRARKTGLSVNEAVVDPAAGAATGQELVARELIWIAIDDMHKSPPEGGLKELIAGMIGVTDTQHVLGPGLKSIRWLLIGHIPDFVREQAIQYKQDIVGHDKIGVDAWAACIRSAFVSAGEEQRYNEGTAKGIFNFSKGKWPALADPVLTLKALANGVVEAIEIMREG